MGVHRIVEMPSGGRDARHSLKLASRYIDFVEIRWEAEMDQRSSLRAVMIAMFLVALFIVGIYAGQHIGLLPRM